MATRSPWDPWGEVRRLQRDLENLFDRSMTPAARRTPAAGDFPAVNVSRVETGLVLEAVCPGVDRGTLDVTLVGDALTIRGERRAEAVPDNRYHRRERHVGPFTRTIKLGDRFDPERVEASYRDGILRVQLSRAPASTARKINIQD